MIVNETHFNCELKDILEELRSQLHANGVNYFEKGFKESGDHLMCQCPFHSDGQERRPSAGFRKSDGKFHCFSCNAVYDLPQVISYCFGYSDIIGKHGFKWLIKNFAIVQVEERKDIELDCSRNSNTNFAKIEYVTEEELDKYRYTHKYMYDRGLTDDVIELFDIGYDRETNSITFPVRDINGNTLFVARRRVDYKYYNYPQGVEKPLYGLYELGRYGMCYAINGRGAAKRGALFSEVIVCEGMFDALTCWVYGKYAVALNGTGTQLQMKQLKELPCRKIILATDNDGAGQTARAKIAEAVGGNKLITQYVLPDHRKDINELSEYEFFNLEEIF